MDVVGMGRSRMLSGRRESLAYEDTPGYVTGDEMRKIIAGSGSARGMRKRTLC